MFSNLSVRTRFALLMSALIGLISIVIYAYFPARLKEQAQEKIVEKAHSVTGMAAFSIAPGLYFEDRADLEGALFALRQNSDLVYVLVFDSANRLFAGFNERIAEQYAFRTIPAEKPAVSSVLRGNRARTKGGFSADRKIYQTASGIQYNGKAIGTIYVGLSMDALNQEIANSKKTIALVSSIIFFFGIVAAFGLSTLITGPLSRIVEAAETISGGDLSRRASVTTGGEVGQLARSFNGMVDRLDAARASMAQLNQNLESRVEERTSELKEEIEERKRAEVAVRISEERYRLLYERNLAGVYVSTIDGQILNCNDACARMFGYSSRAEFMDQAGTIPYVHSHDRDRILARLREEGTVTNEEIQIRTRQETICWILENVRLIEAADGGQATLEGILLDITDRKRAEQEIEYKAYHDALTGLPNRRLFKDRLTVAVAHARRARGNMAVMFLDLDDFKSVNDTLGHAVGDQLLQVMADRLRACLREEDSVARVGGDEFTLLISDIDGEDAASEVAKKVMLEIALPLQVEEDEIRITTSMGVAMYPGDGIDAETLLKNADRTMYRVKERGGNNFQLNSRLPASRSVGRFAMEQELKNAVARDQFVVHYQPQVDLKTRELRGVEALVRWQHPEDGEVIEPAGFISLAEQTGLIIPIGEWVLRKSCEQVHLWHEAGFSDIRVAVNVSARQFHQREFVAMIERVLSESKLAPQFLDLEITESMTMQKSDWTLQMLNSLREMGVKIAVDDFGTGQSSLSYLKRFPIDKVKIDKSFINDVTSDRDNASIVIAILLLADRLGLATVAEGVETEEQCGFLERHLCQDIQGYLVSRPLAANVFQRRFFALHAAAVGSLHTMGR